MSEIQPQIQTWVPENTIRAHAKIDADGITEVSLLVRHPMDSGFEFTPTFIPIPAHYITTLTCRHKNRVVLVSHWGPGVSKDPFLTFRFQGAAAGDKLDVHWVDNENMSDAGSFDIT